MRSASPPYLLTMFFAGLSVVIGLVVVIGWHVDSPRLVSLGLGTTAMHYNNAMAVIFSGLALLGFLFQRAKAARLASTIALLIGSVHLLQYLAKARWNIDFWFHSLLAAPPSIETLNLAPTVAVALFFLNVTLVLLQTRTQTHLAGPKLLQATCLALLAIVACGLWAIFDQAQGSYGWGNLARMAPLSLLCFSLLGLGGLSLAAQQRQADEIDGGMQILTRALVPLVIAGTIVLWAALAKNESAQIREIMVQETAMTGSSLQHSIRSQAYSLRRMAQRLSRSSEPDLDLWRKDARWYVDDHQGKVAIGYIDENHNILEWVGNEEPTPILDEPDKLNTALQEIRQNDREFILSYPNGQAENNNYFLLSTPVNRQTGAFVVAVFQGTELLTGVISPEYLRHFHLEIKVDNQHLFESTSQRSEFHRYWAVTQSLEIVGTPWQLTVWPTRPYYASLPTDRQDVVLVAGLIIATLLMYASQLLERTAVGARRLSESRHQLRLLLENAGEGIYGLDSEGRTTFLNKAAERITGFSAEEMVGYKQHSIIHHSHADGRPYPQASCKIYHVLQEGGSHFERDEVFWHKQGYCFPVEYTVSAMTDEQGGVHGAVVVFRDISELKRMENKLKATNEELESFAYLASHDLKAPLRVINNAAEWLAEDLEEHLCDEDRENMDLLRSRVKRMERLLDDLLLYSRIGRVTDASFQEKINGKAMIDNILALLSPPEHITVTVSEGFGEVETPRMPLQQILYNLIGNAIKHHDKPQGSINISVRALKNDYEFCIEDDGPGIESRYHDKVFEIFRTLRPRDQVEGSGIGLSVVKKYVDLYGGRIELHSQVGKGCRFTIIWPKTVKGVPRL